jgi:hypothetical protein
MANEDKLIEQLVQAQIEKALESKTVVKNDYTEEDVNNLKKINELFLKKHDFEKDQIVKWKKGLKNRRLPTENQPAIVVDILHPPLLSNEEETGSTYFREPLDIILGFINESDGSFIVFHYDSRRFEPYKTE